MSKVVLNLNSVLLRHDKPMVCLEILAQNPQDE